MQYLVTMDFVEPGPLLSPEQMVALLLVQNHAEHRVCAVIRSSADAEEMVGEVTIAFERFLRV